VNDLPFVASPLEFQQVRSVGLQMTIETEAIMAGRFCDYPVSGPPEPPFTEGPEPCLFSGHKENSHVTQDVTLVGLGGLKSGEIAH
jgi:hypothetical protein